MVSSCRDTVRMDRFQEVLSPRRIKMDAVDRFIANATDLVGEDSKQIRGLKAGEKVRVLGSDHEGWTRVVCYTDEKVGYVMTRQLTTRPQPVAVSQQRDPLKALEDFELPGETLARPRTKQIDPDEDLKVPTWDELKSRFRPYFGWIGAGCGLIFGFLCLGAFALVGMVAGFGSGLFKALLYATVGLVFAAVLVGSFVYPAKNAGQQKAKTMTRRVLIALFVTVAVIAFGGRLFNLGVFMRESGAYLGHFGAWTSPGSITQIAWAISLTLVVKSFWTPVRWKKVAYPVFFLVATLFVIVSIVMASPRAADWGWSIVLQILVLVVLLTVRVAMNLVGSKGGSREVESDSL